ncbi:MAG: class I SAM-dependent methyltransferase [Lachnospiraceae bacterium]|nr:class I SAM-dependent methyltransferase [Lachnospiraceae bacterium]
MSKFTEYIGAQFGNPNGFVGSCCCLLMNIINHRMYKQILSNIHVQENSKILDIGYGNGYLLKQLYKRYRPELFGIDISEDMKLAATARNKQAVAAGKCHLSIGDCCDLSYDNDSFDAITSINTVYFWRDTLQGLREIKRCLKTGGTFYNVVYTKEWLQSLAYTQKGFALFEKEDLIALGKEAGFSEVVIKDIKRGKSYMVLYTK